MSFSKPWLSVLVPAYRAERFLPACLSSVTDQMDEGVEVIVLDDASPDATLAAAHAIREQHPGDIRILENPVNRGVSSARNRLLSEARGDYIWLLDADDVLLPGAIASLHAIVRGCSPDLVMCDFRTLRATAPILGSAASGRKRTFQGPSRKLLTDRSRLVSGLLRNRQLHSWSKIGTRALWSRIRYPEGMAMMEDAAIVPALIAGVDRYVWAAEAWIGYREHAGSALSTPDARKLRNLFDAVHLVKEGFSIMHGLDPDARFAVDYYCLRMLAYAARRIEQDPAMADDLRTTSARVFPDGFDHVLSACRRRGWWLRSRRMAVDLRKAGVVT